MKIPDWVQPFIDSSYHLWINHDPQSHLPFDAWGLHPYYNELWLKKIYEMVKKFNEKGYKISDYLDYFPNLSSTRFIMLMNTIHYQTSKMDAPEIISSIQDFFVTSLKLRAKDDLFALEKNVELNDDQLNRLLMKRPVRSVGSEESRELGKILVALASLTHGLYNDWCTDLNYEISGPYVKDKKLYLIRSFPDSRPIDIWPEIDWQFKDFSIITEYEDFSAKMAFVGCHITYSASAVEKLTGYNFQIDGKEIMGLEELKKLRETLMPIAASQYEKFMGLGLEDQKIKYVMQEHYQLKKLFDLVGIDWKPTDEMMGKIINKKLIEGVIKSYDMTKAEYAERFGHNKMICAYNGIN
jgi:hypothetical protein